MLLVSLRSKKNPLKARFGSTRYKHLDLARSEFLRFVASPNESLRYITTDYMFKYTFWITTTLLESLRNQK